MSFYDEGTSFQLNEEIRGDIALLKAHFRCRTLGELFRLLIQLARADLPKLKSSAISSAT